VGYSYSIEYKSGSSNVAADALSRVPEFTNNTQTMAGHALSTTTDHNTNDTTSVSKPGNMITKTKSS
jgi:hypothetical protein